MLVVTSPLPTLDDASPSQHRWLRFAAAGILHLAASQLAAVGQAQAANVVVQPLHRLQHYF